MPQLKRLSVLLCIVLISGRFLKYNVILICRWQVCTVYLIVPFHQMRVPDVSFPIPCYNYRSRLHTAQHNNRDNVITGVRPQPELADSTFCSHRGPLSISHLAHRVRSFTRLMPRRPKLGYKFPMATLTSKGIWGLKYLKGG